MTPFRNGPARAAIAAGTALRLGQAPFVKGATSPYGSARRGRYPEALAFSGTVVLDRSFGE